MKLAIDNVLLETTILVLPLIPDSNGLFFAVEDGMVNRLVKGFKSLLLFVRASMPR